MRRQPGPCGNSARGSSRSDWAVHPANQSPVMLGKSPPVLRPSSLSNPSSWGALTLQYRTMRIKETREAVINGERLSISGKQGISRNNVPLLG